MTEIAINQKLTILALETSCDETAAAVVRGGREIISNVVASQIDEHRRYGGVVPEVASRQHILALDAVISAALAPLPNGWASIDAVAATNGPGLAGALLTGLNAAKAIAFARSLPLIGVNHIEAHVYANWLQAQGLAARNWSLGSNPSGTPSADCLEPSSQPVVPTFPLVALVVSGGHTLLVLLEGHGRYRLLGQTRDDAAGEAFDKSARIMGLGFPGGPAIQQAAAGAASGMVLPRAWLRASYDFSFSGLKTAVLHHVQAHNGAAKMDVLATKSLPARQRSAGSESNRTEQPATSDTRYSTSDTFTRQLAHAFQESVVDVLVTKAVDAAQAFGATEILLAGGVAANARLRAELTRRSPVPVRYPPIDLCTDNAAMVGAAAFYRYESSVQSDWALDVNPNLRLA